MPQTNAPKYPRTGPNYAQYGEVPGYVYYPWNDQYYADPNAVRDWQNQTGVTQPEPAKPGLFEQVKPIVIGAGALEVGRQIGKDPVGVYRGVRDAGASLYEGAEGLFGYGEPAAQATGQAASTGAQAAQTSGALYGSEPAVTGATAAGDASGLFGAGQAADYTLPAWDAGAGAAEGTSSALGGGEAAAGEAAGTSGSSMLGTIGTGAAIAGGLYGAYQLGENLTDNRKDGKGGAMAGAAVGAGSTAAYGAYVGSAVGPVGTVIGMVIGALVGLGLGQIGGNKDVDQLKRDAIRDYLKGKGILDDSYTLKRPDGTSFDMGKDGDAMLPNKGENLDGKKERRYFDVDFSDERAAEIIGQVAPLAAIIGGQDQKIRDDLTGYFVNYVLGSGDPRANVAALYKLHGMDKAAAWQAINDAQSGEHIDPGEGDILRNGLNQAFGGGAPEGVAPAGMPAPGAPQPGAPAPQAAPPAPPPPAPGGSSSAPGGMFEIGSQPPSATPANVPNMPQGGRPPIMIPPAPPMQRPRGIQQQLVMGAR